MKAALHTVSPPIQFQAALHTVPPPIQFKAALHTVPSAIQFQAALHNAEPIQLTVRRVYLGSKLGRKDGGSDFAENKSNDDKHYANSQQLKLITYNTYFVSLYIFY